MNKKIQLKATNIFCLSLICYFSNNFNSYASPSPEKAEIRNIEGPRITIQTDEGESIRATENTILRKNKDALLVPGNDRSKANLTLTYINSDNFTLFTAGPDVTPTVYKIPCKILPGNAIIGYSQGTSACQNGVLISPYRGYEVKLRQNQNGEYFSVLKDYLKAENYLDVVQYCSTVSTSGKGWGVSYSQDLSVDPCQSATEKCQQADRGTQCHIASWGEWNINERQLITSNYCQNRYPFTRKKNGREIGDFIDLMEYRHILGKGIGCVFHVYQPDEIIIVPASDEGTLIQVYDAGDGEIAVDALVGNVRIVSGKKPQGTFITEGSGYRQAIDKRIAIDCQSRFKSGSLQNFLDSSNWSTSNESSLNKNIRQRLNSYRNNFCQSATSRPSGGSSGSNFSILPFLPWLFDQLSPGRDPDDIYDDQPQYPEYPEYPGRDSNQDQDDNDIYDYDRQYLDSPDDPGRDNNQNQQDNDDNYEIY